MKALRRVRAIVDSLKDITAMEALITRYQEIDSSYVVPIAKSLEMPQLVVLNYELTLSVAFYLRGREVLESQALSRPAELVRKAKKNGDKWIVIYFYPNGHIYYSGFYTTDLRSGVWEYFTEDGVSDSIINYNE